MKTAIIKERLQSALVAIMFISVFLPFDLASFGWTRWILLCGIGLVIAFCVLTSELTVDKLLRMPHGASLDSRYVIRRNICFETVNILLSVALMSLFLDTFANNETVDNHFSWQTTGYVFVINCFTTIVIHVYWRSVYKKRYLIKQLEEAQLINGMLQERHRHLTEREPRTSSKSRGASVQSLPAPLADADGDDTICISGATRESLSVRPSQVVFVSSERNYVRVHYVVDSCLRSMLIRTSMKSVSDIICSQPYIMQCHRAYIVNLQYVVKVENRSSGIALVMRHCAETVLVSKQYSAEVKERIKNPPAVIYPPCVTL